MELETKRLCIRDYIESDFTDYFHLKSDEKTMYYLQDIKLSSKEEAMKDFLFVLKDLKQEERTCYFFRVEDRHTKEQIGSVGYTVVARPPVGKIVQLGYFTYPKFWNNGYVTEAATKIIEYAFQEDDVYRILTGCLAENVGSKRVMEKCGMIKEAEHLEWEWHDGKMKTRLEYRLLKREWIAGQGQ